MTNPSNQTTVDLTLVNFKKILVPCISIELFARNDVKERALISDFLLSVVSSVKIHTLFTKKGLDDIAETIFNNVVVREFILSLTYTYMIEIDGGFNSLNAKEGLVYILSRHFDETIETLQQNKRSPYLLNQTKQVNEFLFLNALNVSNVLKANSWLILVVLIHLSFQEVTEAITFSQQ